MSKSVAKYSAGYELNVSRGVRLKFVALQMPIMIKFLRKYTAKFNTIQMRHKFQRWLAVYKVWKIEQMELLQKQTVAVIPIQAAVRGFNGRRHFNRIQSSRIEAFEKKKQWSMYQIQLFVKLWLRRFRAQRHIGARREMLRNLSAILIQKVFRGFLSKAHTVELEKLKLIRQLRKWSHGISNHLVNMKELQNGYSQSVLYHALSITTLSSRPLRNLPKLQYVRTVRRSLYLLYWRLQAHYSSTKEEYRMRQAERRGMFLQDLFSNMVEIHILGDMKRLEAKQREYELQLLREREEEARRQAMADHLLLVDFNSKAAAKAQQDAERAIQAAYKQKLARLALEADTLARIRKEAELMHVEEVVTHAHYREQKRAAEKRLMLQQQAKLVENARLAGVVIYGEKASLSKTVLSTQLQKLVPRIVARKNRLLPPPPTASEIGVALYKERAREKFAHAVESFQQYLATLPLEAEYVHNVRTALLRSREEVVFPVVPGVTTKKSGAKIVLPAANSDHAKGGSPSHHSASSGHAHGTAPPAAPANVSLDPRFVTKQLSHANVSAVLQPVRTLASLRPVSLNVPVGIKGMLSRAQLVQLKGEEGHHLSIAQQQHHMDLLCSLAVDDDAVSKMRLLLQLKKARYVRALGYKHLVTEHAKFRHSLKALHAKRSEIHATKYLTRQERKNALQEAAVIEARVLELRHSLVAICTSFYGSFHDEVELFLCLFYPVEVKPEENQAAEDDKHDKIVSKKILFDSSHPNAISYHATSDSYADHSEKFSAHSQASSSSSASSRTTQASQSSGKLGRRSSRIDAVYIAPKRKEQGASSKIFRSKRESVVYSGSTAKKPHVVDPYHALHQVPINKTLQHKLSLTRKPVDRLLMYNDYWATIHLDMEYYNLSPVDIVSLPSAPIPTFHNDGKPHILKYSQTGASKRINASHVHKHFDAKHMSVPEKLKLKESQLKHQKMMKKEVKLHDIPGFNLFQDSDEQEYDFCMWAEKVIVWCKELTHWFRLRERSWRQHHRAQALTYLLRLQYLAEGQAESEHSAPTGSDVHHIKASNMLVRKKLLAKMHQEEERRKANKRAHTGAEESNSGALVAEHRHEQNSLYLLRHLDQADVLDVFEVLLCRSNIGLKVAGSENKAVFTKGTAASSAAQESNKSVPFSSKTSVSTAPTASTTGSRQQDTHSTSLSRLVTADELDVTVAKHPASLTARFLLIHQALSQESVDATADPSKQLLLSCQNSLLFGVFASSISSSATGETAPSPQQEENELPPAVPQITTALTTTASPAPSAASSDAYLKQGIFHGVHPSLLLLQSLRRETAEMQEIISRLFADKCIAIELTAPAGASAGKSSKPNPTSVKSQFVPITTEDFRVDIHYAKIRPVQYIQCEKDYEVWRYRFPSWMQPVVHFGTSAPAETFVRRLQHELRTGHGVYANIDAVDRRADAAARVMLRFLRQYARMHVFVREKAMAAYRVNVDQCMMQWEDTLGAAVRMDAETKRIEQLRLKEQNRSFLSRLLTCFRATGKFTRGDRVVHSLGDDEFISLNDNPPSTSLVSTKRPSFRWKLRPKYAKIMVFTTEDELRDALRAGLQSVLPVQSYPFTTQIALEREILREMYEICRTNAHIPETVTVTVDTADGAVETVTERASDPVRALLSKYAFLDDATEVCDVIAAAVTARDAITPETHFRSTSWVTGQAVHLNAQGQHITVPYTAETLNSAGALYTGISTLIDQTCTKHAFPSTKVTGNKSDGIVTANSSAKSHSAGASQSAPADQRGADRDTSARAQPLHARAKLEKPEKIRVHSEQLPVVVSATAPVQEMHFGGGLRNLLSVIRVVENAEFNPRGVVVMHSMLLPHLEPQLPSITQFEVKLSEAESVRMMNRNLAAQAKAEERKLQLMRDRASKRRGSLKGASTKAASATTPASTKSVKEASVTIAKFIRKRGATLRRMKSGDLPTAPLAAPAVGSIPSTAASAPAASVSPSKTAGAVAPVSAEKAQPQRSPSRSVKGSSRSSSSSKASKSPTKPSPLEAVEPVPAVEDAKATIAKFLRSRAFNLSVNKRSKKYNYNGSKYRTEVKVKGTRHEHLASKKISKFMRSRSKGKLLTEHQSGQDAQTRAAEAAAEAAERLREAEEDARAVYCATMFDLFTSARAGFSDRRLCHDRLWQFATAVTSKSRNLCNLSQKALTFETVVRKLPTLRELQSILVLAVFRERYARFAASAVPKRLLETLAGARVGAAAGHAHSQLPLLTAQAHLDGKADAAATKRCVELLQGLCKIYHAKKLVKLRRVLRRNMLLTAFK